MDSFKNSLFLFSLLICFGNVFSEEIASPPVTNWGEWNPYQYCPEGTLAKGFQLKHQPSQGPLIDDTALNGIRLFCGYTTDPDVVNITSGEGTHGQWGRIYSCQLGFIYGFQLRVEHNGIDDETATNNIRVFCTDHDPDFYIEGDGNIWGLWGVAQKCNRTQGLRGLQTQIQPDGGALHDDTAMNNLAAECSDIPPPPTEAPSTTIPTTTTPTTPTTTPTTPTTTPTTTTTVPTTTTPTTPIPTTTTPTTPIPTTTVQTSTTPTTAIPTTTRVTSSPDPSTSVIIDTVEDFDGHWEQRCAGGYHESQEFSCNGDPVIPSTDYNDNRGFWSKCAQESVFECRLIYRSNATDDWRSVTVDAYFAGIATVELQIQTSASYDTTFLNGTGWESIKTDLSEFVDIQQIQLSVEYQSSSIHSVIDKITIEH